MLNTQDQGAIFESGIRRVKGAIALLIRRFQAALHYRWQILHRHLVLRWLLWSQSRLIQVTDRPAIVFVPHQDDETLGCGGLIATKRQQGVPVRVVFLTDGSACYPAEVPILPAQVSQIRQQESLLALEVLGVEPSHVTFLKYPDAKLQHLTAEQTAQLLQELQEILHCTQPAEVYIPYCQDFHPDHIATHRLVSEALTRAQLPVQLWQYLVWSLWCPEYLQGLRQMHRDGLYRIAIRSVQAQKRIALQSYRSQYEPPTFQRYAVLPKGFMRFFCSPNELFVVTAGVADFSDERGGMG